MSSVDACAIKSDALLSFKWHYYERNGVLNYRRLDCLANRFSGVDQINIKAPRHWHLWVESTRDGWKVDSLTKGQ